MEISYHIESLTVQLGFLYDAFISVASSEWKAYGYGFCPPMRFDQIGAPRVVMLRGVVDD